MMKTKKALWCVALSAALVAGIAGCHSNSVNAQSGPDPAAANLAQSGAENEAQQQAGQYQDGQQQPAPIERAYSQQSAPPPGYYDNGQQAYPDQGDEEYQPVYDDSLTDEQATEPPPPLPDYDQPPDPDPDYIWTPGYWAWGPEGYYWVPGCWVDAPYVGALWTPGYWGFVGGAYRFHHGYWGRHIGFYGGVNYGFGYFGVGYEGGYWNGGHFFYNTRVTRVNATAVRNVYVHNVTVNNRGPRVSFNGGRGGLQVRPRPAEVAAIHEQRYAPTQSQEQVRQQSSQNRQQFFNANHGRPAEAAAAHPVTGDHRMPAEMPRAAAVARPNAGKPAESARPGQQGPVQQQGRPEFRNAPQQGGQNVPRGNAASEAARPGQTQQGRPDFQRGQEARPVQPQNEVRPQTQPQPQSGRSQFDGRGQAQGRAQQAQPQAQPQPQQNRPQLQQRQQPQPAQPQAQPQQQRQDFHGQQNRPQFQQRQQAAPQVQPRPQEMRQQPQPQAQPRPQQGPPPQAQHAAPPQPQHQAAPQPQHQGPPPQAHDNGHGGGDGHDKH